ncbi:hypothetical protein DMH01_32535 [Amycolatopsis sp. WAC 04182]|uniref:hypothetical protein n=1 Tax=Amycolatopsis sp. WAC 04182 TaxID=2203198 RepID=UPI000F7A45E7|nr:hypothetical protein [Amycolatopsis sp. WAC 04182]RSN55072.1 hypothetical protein DMH01_32535 [Amycolatopsis sp. WAC 04182]
MTDSTARQDPFGLTGLRDHQEYVDALKRLAEQGRGERRIPLLSETEAHVVAELLGQFAIHNPIGHLNQLGA